MESHILKAWSLMIFFITGLNDFSDTFTYRFGSLKKMETHTLKMMSLMILSIRPLHQFYDAYT